VKTLRNLVANKLEQTELACLRGPTGLERMFTAVSGAGFQTCCIAGFQAGSALAHTHSPAPLAQLFNSTN
jgi:hypothetical protein